MLVFFENRDPSLRAPDESKILKNKFVRRIYHHLSDRKRQTVLEGLFNQVDFTTLKVKMGLGGFFVKTSEQAQKHGLKLHDRQLALIVLRGFHWGASNGHLKLKKVLNAMGIQINLIEGDDS